MSETNTLLRELIGEVRALRGTVAAGHALQVAYACSASGALTSDDAFNALLNEHRQDLLGAPSAAPANDATTAAIRSMTERLSSELAELRVSIQALRDDQRRANALAIMEGAEPCSAAREAGVRQALAARGGSPE
jgi:hypothetical protein